MLSNFITVQLGMLFL